MEIWHAFPNVIIRQRIIILTRHHSLEDRNFREGRWKEVRGWGERLSKGGRGLEVGGGG